MTVVRDAEEPYVDTLTRLCSMLSVGRVLSECSWQNWVKNGDPLGPLPCWEKVAQAGHSGTGGFYKQYPRTEKLWYAPEGGEWGKKAMHIRIVFQDLDEVPWGPGSPLR